jgi:GxxExxY protein
MPSSSGLVCPDLSFKVLGILFKVHNKLGAGLLEKHYSKAIEIELKSEGLKFNKEQMVNLEYEKNNIGKFFIDFVIEGQLVLELKATRIFKESAFKQAYSYLKQLELPLAIVCNFHSDRLRYKRIINPHYHSNKE